MKGMSMGVPRILSRHQPWCWQEKSTMRSLRENYAGERKTTAIAIYQALTELASNASHPNTFNAYYSEIAKLVGKSVSTIRVYCREFIKYGFISKQNRKIDDKKNLSNKWTLLSTSVSNNKQTSNINDYIIFDNNNDQLIEEDHKEEINENVVSTEGYKKAWEVRQKLGSIFTEKSNPIKRGRE